MIRSAIWTSLRQRARAAFSTKYSKPAAFSRGKKWTRVVMDAATSSIIDKLTPCQLDVLEISGHGWRDRAFKSYRSVHFPSFDVCDETLSDKFDLVIAEQVFEHLRYPYRAGKNIFAMLRPGGGFLVTTPFMFPIHEHPIDCTRWSECGIAYFLEECGFPACEIVTGSWGNRECVKSRLDDPDRGVVYDPSLHSLVNEPRFPVVVWALARRIS